MFVIIFQSHLLWGCIKASWCAVARVDCGSKMAANWWRHQNACESMWGFTQVHLELSLFCSIYYNIRLIDNITLYIWLIDWFDFIDTPHEDRWNPKSKSSSPFWCSGSLLQDRFASAAALPHGAPHLARREGGRGARGAWKSEKNGDRWDELLGFHQQTSGDLPSGKLT